MTSSLLACINCPSDLRKLPRSALLQVARELREFVLESVSQTGGHLASNLGVVELTVALHHVFDTPHDRIVWDVGHQTYPHKILTGRASRMKSIRQLGGLSGFPRRDESEYDTFGVGHSSTSISAALGMAFASRQRGDNRRVVAVIGDGALSGGLAFEALNNAGCHQAGEKPNLLIVLNDNDMSISGPVGALSDHLRSLGKLGEQPVAAANMFEALGIEYVGPVDGHDVFALREILAELRGRSGPHLLHVVTRKGKGYALAEADPVKYHAAAGRFDAAIGFPVAPPSKPTFTQVFGRWLCDTAQADPTIVGVTPAMCEGSGMTEFRRRFPERYYDVGIAEQHALAFAAGLACEGIRPIVAIYSTFLQRGYDQVVHDIALQNLPVVFAIDRGGLVGADGATHAGAYDIAYLRCVPNMAILTPSDADECRRALDLALASGQPAAVRYPRGVAPEASLGIAPPPRWGKAEMRRRGGTVAILAFGTLLHPALKAAEVMNAAVVDMRFAKPLDTDMIRHIATTHEAIVTIEEGTICGGAGSGVMEFLHRAGLQIPVLQLGLSDEFIEHGAADHLLAAQGLDAAGIERAIRRHFASLFSVSPRPASRSRSRPAPGSTLIAVQPILASPPVGQLELDAARLQP